MREEGTDHVILEKRRLCGGYGHVVGSVGRVSRRISLDCGRWDCPKCRKVLTKIWMERITKYLRGSVLYAVRTMRHGKALSARIRRNIKKVANYFCAHLVAGALVFSNARFKGAEPRNKKKFLNEIRALMERGEVTAMSRRQGMEETSEDDAPNGNPWSFALITEEIKPEYDECKSDYEIGLLLLIHSETGHVRRLHPLGKELLRKIHSNEINAVTCNLKDLKRH